MVLNAQPTGKKRKIAYDTHVTSAQAQKRQKNREAHEIPSQTADMAMSTSGELNIASFIKSREFQIQALDRSMKKSREALMTRAFQSVPRHMRRRTASHNAKKVPKRLRVRALREMQEDNTPKVTAKTRTPSSKIRLRMETVKAIKRMDQKRKDNRKQKQESGSNAKHSDPEKHVQTARVPRIKKNKLCEPPRAISKFKRRQVNKTWMPTHLWHVKRARMTRPTEPLWRMAIPISPTEKCYRSTHRATGSRGCIAWDMSYISTVSCMGTDTTIEGLLRGFGFAGELWSGGRYKMWRAGTRSANGWVFEHDNEKRPIAPVTVIWCPQRTVSGEEVKGTVNASNIEMEDADRVKKVQLNRQIMIRIHPSAFHQFWTELLKVAKIQKPQVLVEDLRFEIGSIDVVGPGSTEALVGVLKSSRGDEHVRQTWPALAGLSNPSLLPANAVLAFDVEDPRLNHPPKQVEISRDEASIATLNELLVSWPPDSSQRSSPLFSHKSRWKVGQALLSQRGINRLKALSLPGQSIKSSASRVQIPVILLAHRSTSKDTGAQGQWSILLPWKCVDPIWRSLTYYPLSSGSVPRFGGLDESRQTNFEKATPWFPGDMPGTEAGKAWERTQSQERFDHWIRRPPSRRYAWHALDLGLNRKGELGNGWACDWDYLLQETNEKNQSIMIQKSVSTVHRQTLPIKQPLLTQRQRKAAKQNATVIKDDKERRRNTSSPESDVSHVDAQPLPEYGQVSGLAASKLLQTPSKHTVPKKPVLVTVRISLLTKGTPNAAARIYRLPKSSPSSMTADPIDGRETTSPQLPTSSTTLPGRNKRNHSLRSRWLALDTDAIPPNPNSSTSLPSPFPKDKLNRHSLPRQHRTYGPESLSHIRVFPKNAPKEVKEMYGPPPARRTNDQILADLIPRPVAGEENMWDEHIPCPDAGDLIGFVTSGGYNLAKGKGTAIGALWLQRVAGGWMEEDAEERDKMQAEDSAGSSTAQSSAFEKQGQLPQRRTQDKHDARRRDRERHLCIVRNAGESIGRLGIWEICL